MNKFLLLFNTLMLLLFIQGCSGNGFKLRKNIDLAPKYQALKLEGVSAYLDFKTVFSDALVEAGGRIVENTAEANSTLVFTKISEGRRVIAYTSERRAREYLVFLKIEYGIRQQNNKNTTDNESLTKWRLNIDRSYLYDPDFALGKAEEEKRVKRALYEEATRLIMLRLKYAEQSN